MYTPDNRNVNAYNISIFRSKITKLVQNSGLSVSSRENEEGVGDKEEKIKNIP